VQRLTQDIGNFIATCVELRPTTREPMLQEYLAFATTTAVDLANRAVSGTSYPVVDPPTATIQVGFDASHNMRWECTHTSPEQLHCWDYSSGTINPTC
jgi:hypothetical protein